MAKKTYSIICLGCKVNDYEANYTRELLSEEFSYVDYKEGCADIVIVYSCLVTNVAEAKTRKMINQAIRLNPDALIIVVGCFASLRSEYLKGMDNVKIIIGSFAKTKILDHIHEYFENKEAIIDIESPIDPQFESMPMSSYHTKTRSFLKIQDGCNQFCAYCAIPYARGRERSLPYDKLIEEADKLADDSHEIVLTGIHTGRYSYEDYRLIDVLKGLLQIDKDFRIRLSSIEITEVTDEMIQLIADNPRLVKHLHIPIQSACDKILASMKRPYDVAYYLERVKKIRSLNPGISISTDLIVGFPGENEDDFKKTLANIRKINFSFIHCFPYSRKANTLADTYPDHVSENIKKQRVREVLDLSKRLKSEYAETFIGKRAKVLIEKVEEGRSYGYTGEYLYVEIDTELEHNSLVDVLIKEINGDRIRAEYVTE